MPASATSKTRTRSEGGGLEAFQKRLAQARKGGGHRVKIGLPKGAADYPDGTSVIMVGAVHEFGSDDGTIPERSFLRSAMAAKAREHKTLARDLARAVVTGDRDPNAALELLGTVAASNVKEQIALVSTPINADSTVRAKGSSNPLIDTGHLRQQITHQVMSEGE